MRSKEIADLAGVTVRTLRHYRKIGLLREPERAENGYCEYTVNDLVRLLRIKTLSSLGFSLVDIAHMLDADDAAQGGSAYDDKLDELDRELASQIEGYRQKSVSVYPLFCQFTIDESSFQVATARLPYRQKKVSDPGLTRLLRLAFSKKKSASGGGKRWRSGNAASAAHP